MSSDISWKQSFLQSAGTEAKDGPSPSRLMDMGEVMRDRGSFVSMVNWTVNDGVIEAKNNLIVMKNEHFRLIQEEDRWRKQHNHSRGNLQEAWDKLVQLRTHISLFRSAIEEATIEDVSSQAAAHAWKSSLEPENVNGSRVPLTVEAAIKLGDVHGIREKIRLKEGLQRKVALIEELLADLRMQLTRHSSELTRVNTLGDPSFSDSVGSSMVLRQAVISISQQLEDAESEYLSSRKELELVEIELSSVLEKARTSGDAIDKERTALEAANAPISHTEEHLSSLVGAVLQGREPPPALTALTARIPNNNPPMPPPRCEFSLHEVLSGYARVTRLNGEEPRQYRARLEKRLGALMILDQQLQDELLAKTEDVRRDRDRLREMEVLRLRVELQVSNSENSIRQLESEAMVRQGRSDYLQHLAHTAHTTSPSTDHHRSSSSSSSMGGTGAYRQLDGQFAVAALSEQPALTDAHNASMSNSAMTTHLPGSLYSPKVDKAALRSAQKSRVEGFGLGSPSHNDHRYPSDRRSGGGGGGGGGSSLVGTGERDGRGEDSDDAYARVIAQLSLADGDVASEANDPTLAPPGTRGTAAATNASSRASYHPTKAGGSPTNHQQQSQQSAAQRPNRSGLATLDEASVSRLQSAAKLLERDLARGHRLQDANVSPSGITSNNNNHHPNYQVNTTMARGQAQRGDYRDNFGPKTSSPSSSSFNASSSSSSNAHANPFSPGAASPSNRPYDVNTGGDYNTHTSSNASTSRSPVPFPLVERYDSKTGRRLKDPVIRGYPHQHPPLDYQHHIYDPDMNMDATHGGYGYEYGSSGQRPEQDGPHSYQNDDMPLPEGHLAANLGRPNRVDMYDEHRRQTAFDRRLHEQTQYLHQQGLRLQQQQNSNRQPRSGVFYGSPEDDDDDVDVGVDAFMPREEEVIDDGNFINVNGEGGYHGYHGDDRAGPVTDRQRARARSASPQRLGSSNNQFISQQHEQQQHLPPSQTTKHRAFSSDGRRPREPPSSSYATQYNSRAAAAAAFRQHPSSSSSSTRNKQKAHSPTRFTTGSGGATIAWEDGGGLGMGPGSPSSPSGQHPGAASIQRLKGIQAKLAEAMNNEIIDPDTGVATDSEGRSMGFVAVNVISARNLPETKKLSASADPYVEVVLLPSDDPRVLAVVGNSFGLSLIDTMAEDAAGVNGVGPHHSHLNRHAGTTRRGRQRYASTFDASDASSAGGCRTSARWSTLFPEWREELRLSLPLREVTQQTLLIRVKDTSKLGESEDELIGQCVVPLHTLMNQQLHKSWIPLYPPPDWNPRFRARYSDSCAVRLEMRLFFCRRLLLQHRFDAMVEVLTKSRDQNASALTQQSSVLDEYSEPAKSLGKNRSLSSRGGGHVSNVASKSSSGAATSHRAGSSSSSNAANGNSKVKAPITQTTPVGAFLTQVIGLQASSSSSFSANGATTAMTTSSSRRTDATASAAMNGSGGTKEGDAMTMAQYQAMLHAAPTSSLNNGAKNSKSSALNRSSRSPPHHRPNHTNTAAAATKTTANAAVAASAEIKAPRKKFKLVGLRERDAMKIYDSEAGEVYKSQLGDRSGFSWLPPTRVGERTPEDSERARRSGGSVVIKKTRNGNDTATANSSSGSGTGNLRVFDAASYFEQASLNMSLNSHSHSHSNSASGNGGGGRIIQPITGRRRNGATLLNDHGNSVDTASASTATTTLGGSPARKQRSQLDDSSLLESGTGTGTAAGTKRSRREATVTPSLRQPPQARDQKKMVQTKSKYPANAGLGGNGNGPVQHSPPR